MQKAELFSWLRAMSGGKLTQAQVEAGDRIIAEQGIEIFAQLIGFKLDSKVSGQWDISENGYALIRDFEGFRDKAYRDTGGVWTLGFGTIKYPDGRSVKQGDTCTREQAEQWLKSDCRWVDACLDKYVKATISQNQFDALASFVYNIGESQFRSSTLLAKLNAGDYRVAAANFDRWIYDNGKIITGLVNRRAQEKALFVKG
ncbi:lysozyme [Acinetobacter radioresistens]|uniref:lysozyme n=1 Tax=Acinetobacter radioresistens TaxID=40216 RepID=UPI00124D7DE9|nr:lysozyme [Acinetobacter radioresistens]MCU4622844.1 lysozyme [Acinetobacter radioresistens]MCX0349947.1 lysozyme [Acinetobacter radioresistens]